MIAWNLAGIILELSHKADMSGVTREDVMERLESLRGYGMLPRGREKRNQQLTDAEIAATVLGWVTLKPGWAGHAAKLLCSFKAVGGIEASFCGTDTLQKAIERLLTDGAARKGLVTLTVSGAESGINSHGSATLIHEVDGVRHRVHYVPAQAISLLQAGMEKSFDASARYAPLSRDSTFTRHFFERLARSIELARTVSAPMESDGAEYEAEEAREERFRKLGARPGSVFLQVGVDNQVTWPKAETVMKFDSYTLVLMPKTRDHACSIHVDLTTNKLSDRDARTVISRFLSIMTWCDDQFAIAQEGWSGNPVPVAVPRRDLAFTTAQDWIFDRKIPTNVNARRALALYREARNAQQNYMVSYAVLNYFKVVELGHQSKGDVKNWFRDNFEVLRQQSAHRADFDKFVEICNGEKPHEYIWKACRVAVSHANKDSKSDPDDANELVRLHKAADILRVFARHFITSRLDVSERKYSGD